MSTSTLDSVLAEALQMPDNDRARIAEQLISSLDDSVDPDVEALWQQEIQHRLQEIRDGSVQCIPWEDMRQRLTAYRHATG